LDVLADRKTGGKMGGTILVNGKPRDKFFNRFTGYLFSLSPPPLFSCSTPLPHFPALLFLKIIVLIEIRYVEQSNILMPLATVRETIAFAAETRLSGKTKEQKMNKVESILGIINDDVFIYLLTYYLLFIYIGLLDLDECRNQVCANLSMEQKKRVTIGVELAADPCLLFLDGIYFYIYNSLIFRTPSPFLFFFFCRTY
jgi:ABC-type multidrug transport system ATPase subunit